MNSGMSLNFDFVWVQLLWMIAFIQPRKRKIFPFLSGLARGVPHQCADHAAGVKNLDCGTGSVLRLLPAVLGSKVLHLLQLVKKYSLTTLTAMGFFAPSGCLYSWQSWLWPVCLWISFLLFEVFTSTGSQHLPGLVQLGHLGDGQRTGQIAHRPACMENGRLLLMNIVIQEYALAQRWRSILS